MTRFPPGMLRLLMALSTISVAAALAMAEPAQQRPSRGRPAGKSSPHRVLAVAKESEAARDEIALIDLDAGTWTPMAADIGRGGRASWDGSRYAWVEPPASEGKEPNLCILDLGRAGGPRKIAMEMYGGRLSWSPDGRELIVTTGGPGGGAPDRRTWRVAADGSRTTRLNIPPTDLVVDWSRDGRWLATSSARPRPGEGRVVLTREDLRVIRPDGTGDRLVHRLAGSSFDDPKAMVRTSPPRFSPNSRMLLWLESERGDTNESRIMVQDLDGDTPREILRVRNGKEFLSSACWSPDSRSILLHFGEGSRGAGAARFDIIDLNGRKIQTLRAAGVPEAGRRVIIYTIDWR